MARKPQEPPQLTNYFLPAMRLCKIFKSQGVRGAHLGIHPQPLEDPPPIDRSVPEPPEIVIERYGSPSEYQRAARPSPRLAGTGFSEGRNVGIECRWADQAERERFEVRYCW